MAAGAEEFGGIDVLVNNAFRFDAFQSFEDVDLAIWRKIMDTNLFGSLQMTQGRVALHARARWRLGRHGGVDGGPPTATGAGGLRHFEGGAPDCDAGAGLRARTVKVRVNAVVPGWMAGPSVDIYIDLTSTGRGVPAQVVVDELNARVPLGGYPATPTWPDPSCIWRRTSPPP